MVSIISKFLEEITSLQAAATLIRTACSKTNVCDHSGLLPRIVSLTPKLCSKSCGCLALHKEQIQSADVSFRAFSSVYAGRPEDSGISLQIVQDLGPRIPVFGVCMGHQCIGQIFGGRIIRAPEGVMHGKTSLVYHNNTSLLRVSKSICISCMDGTRWYVHVVPGGNMYDETQMLSCLHQDMACRNKAWLAACSNVAMRGKAACIPVATIGGISLHCQCRQPTG